MKIRSKAAAILAALSLMGGTAIAAPAQAVPAQSEATNVDSNICVVIVVTTESETIIAGVCVIYSDGSY